MPIRSSKDVLVLTTNHIGNIDVKRYLKPVSAHIVAGTNLFSDFLGGLSDVFGGRSSTYQKQLESLYNDAIERLKKNAYELGADCILGLKIDMDEISGKGKSMFMITAYGTAVILEKISSSIQSQTESKSQGLLSIDRLDTIRKRKLTIEKAKKNELDLNEETKEFIITNGIYEILPFLFTKYKEKLLLESTYPDDSSKYYQFLVSLFASIPYEKQIELLYQNVESADTDKLAHRISYIISDLRLFDFKSVVGLLNNENFTINKRALRLATFDKAFYTPEDVSDLYQLLGIVKQKFVEKGKVTTKKQLLSSKEKQVWECECGKINDMDTFCTGCQKDIYGFKTEEVNPEKVFKYLEEKIQIIQDNL